MFVQRATTAVSKSEAIKVLNNVASHLRLRTEHEVPTEPGTCIHGGFVAWLPEFERASLGVRLKEFPDVHFSLEPIKNQNHLVESSALEPRLKSAEKDCGHWYSDIKFFRRGPRDLGKWTGFGKLVEYDPEPAVANPIASAEKNSGKWHRSDEAVRPERDEGRSAAARRLTARWPSGKRVHRAI